jgi:CYTH domain-containing protein
MAAEIERKWVAPQTPSADRLGAGTPLRQGYLAIDGDVAVRVRIAPDEAWVTIKAGDDGLRRTEVEVPVDATEAEELWVHTSGRIEKVRHDVAVDDAAAVVDVFGGELSGLCVVEVEFPTESEAEAFVAPDWFGQEVTGRSEWTNASLSRFGRPDQT